MEMVDYFSVIGTESEIFCWYGSKEWADENLRYILGLLGDNSSWNLPGNWWCKRFVAEVIIERLAEAGYEWHCMVASGHFHRWLKRKSWVPVELVV